MMDLEQATRELGFSGAAAEAFAAFWRAGAGGAESALDGAGTPAFLAPGFAEEYAPMLDLPAGLTADLSAAFARVRAAAAKSEALRLYARLAHDGVYLAVPRLDPSMMELPPAVLHDDAGAFYLLLAMASLPLLAARNRERGWPGECVAGVGRWIGGTVPIYQAAHQWRPGHAVRQTRWLRRSLDGELFRLGRLEFEPQPAPAWLPAVFQRRADGRVVARCRDGWRLGADGFRLEDNDPAGRRAALDYDNETVRGVPIDLASGRAEPGRVVELPLAEYESRFAAYEMLAGVHIPGGERLVLAAARESLLRARDFFRDCLHKNLAGFCCRSWILNPDWQAELPTSNLARFQRAVHLFPLPPAPHCGEFFIFGKEPVDYAAAPADNAMQRAFHHLHAAGRPLREGGMFLLPEDLGRFGE